MLKQRVKLIEVGNSVAYQKRDKDNTPMKTPDGQDVVGHLRQLVFESMDYKKDSIPITLFNDDAKGFGFSVGHAGELQFQLTRPVFNATYNTTVFSRRDTEISFDYVEHEPLEFNETNMDNNLTTLLAYYAYLFIGLDLDTFSPKGGTEVLHMVESIVNNAQSISEPGWKAFSNNKNRHAIINDYMETSMEPFRQMMYKYHREGLDEMSSNVDRGRTAITESIEMLKAAYDNKPLSMLPQTFTDFKRDELVNIYRGHGNQKEKDAVYETLLKINASQNMEWKKIQK